MNTRRGSDPRVRGPIPVSFVIAWAVVAMGLAVVPQTPAPTGQAPAGQSGQAPPPGAPAPGAPAQDEAGRGRGRRGGGQDLTGIDFTKQPPVLPKTPEEQLKQFILQPGYRLELVLADPIIQEPTAIAFDGNGRMFVVEDRSYMLDLDMTGQLDPISRISLHVDTNNDGVYDKHTVFVDNMVFPRFVTPFGPDTILTKESNAQEVWKYTDTNRDGVADKKELFDTGYGRLANIEGQEAFLTWTLDNWMYSTYNAFRARWTPHGVIREPTGSNRGEWGVTQDNDGKMWFESGAPGVPVSFQFPIVYGNFTVPDELEPDFRIPWGAPVRVADMQGGLNATRMPDGSLKSVTGSAGNDIYRGHRLPKDLVGEYLYGEPVGRIVRRIHAEKKEGLTFLHNAYPNNEFIKSLDPYFRPVDVTTAPDGTVYITDMYHGIIQVGNFAGPGTYLRARVQQYDLDKVIHKGRIWRLVYDGVKPDRSDALRRDRVVPRMNGETAAQLVRHLTHPNGWWRDTAQQLLVLKQDKSVVPALQLIVRNSKNLLARFHAMWTLEGLGALKPAMVRQLMEDPEPRMRIQAIRASETLFKAGDRSFAADYARLARDPSVDVVIQSLLTMNRWKAPDAAATLKATMESNPARGVQLVATTMLNPPAGRGGGGRGGPPTAEQQKLLERGAAIYNEMCFACHAPDGLGTPKPELATTMAPPLAGSPRVNGHRDYIIKTVLGGLTGPVDGKTYTDMMIPMNNFDDEWIAAVSSYVRHNFGNTAGYITPADVARVRAANADRKTLWTLPELTASLPAPLFTDGWKVTASHNSDAAIGALSLTAWNAGGQQAGMWFQVELPAPETVTEIQFQSPPPGGRGGSGSAAATTSSGAPIIAPPGFPRGFKVEVSSDGTSWKPVAEAAGNGPSTIVTFPPVQAKFVRMSLTASPDDAPAWSIQSLRIFALPRGAL
jgi:mono/diheme cytochrome c family protein